VNHWSAVSVARNKVLTLMEFDAHAVPTLEWTVNPDVAQQWWKDGADVVVRGTTTGQGGAGIRLITQGDAIAEWPLAPLYTKYAKKRTEYRLHVWRGDLLDIQEKRRRSGSEADSRIRSYDNGWIFARENVAVPECVSKAAVAAVNALNLDFGAVDVGYNAHYDRPIVFEVNTAPGLEGTTLERYAEKAKELR
jgi:glutathione synthase/RimK-type ligase-like ATP-grasp enzyme